MKSFLGGIVLVFLLHVHVSYAANLWESNEQLKENNRQKLIDINLNYLKNIPKLDIENYHLIFSKQIEMRKQFFLVEKPNKNCISGFRSALYLFRVSLDEILDALRTKNDLIGNRQMFSQIGIQTFVDEALSDHELSLKTGDIILMRGGSFISSLIAKIGDDDSVFSHAGIVGEDSLGQKYMIESVVERGVQITPLSQWLKKEEVKATLYRYRNQVIASQAGKKIYDYIHRRLKAEKTIPYDFSMNPDDHAQMFCSEVVRVAYELATDGKVVFPKNKTSFYKIHDKDLFQRLGIDRDETFSPNDIELEDGFDLIAEYRFLDVIQKNRNLDIIIDSLLMWSTDFNYHFTPNLKAFTLSSLAKMARKLGFGKEKIQKHMPRKMIATVVRLNDLVNIIGQHLEKKARETFLERKKSLTFKDLEHEVENYREEDCLLYWNDQRSNVESDNDEEIEESESFSKFHYIYNNSRGICHFKRLIKEL